MEKEEKRYQVLEELFDRLSENIDSMQESNEDMEEMSWNLEQGVLISGNEADVLTFLLKRVLSIKDHEGLLDQTLLLNWSRQWTDLYKKKKEHVFIRVVKKFMLEFLLREY